MICSFLRYRALEARLWFVRWRNAEEESPEEDTLLDGMEVAWEEMGDSDRQLLMDEGPRCWPFDPNFAPPNVSELPKRDFAVYNFEDP